ncbi:MAG: CARDB domain-containing protein, partial [Candidatus Margulisiibacteriota bacterium]
MKKIVWFLVLLVFGLAFVCLSFAAATGNKVPPEPVPDLVVSDVKAAQPDKNSNQMVVTYTVKNRGNASSEASVTGISAGGKLVKHNTPPLDPGDSFSASCSYNL